MDKSSAAAIVDAILNDFGPRLDESIRDLSVTGPTGAQFNAYRRAAGRVLGCLYLNLAKPIFATYPDLEPDSLKNEHAEGEDGEPPIDAAAAEKIEVLMEELRLWLARFPSGQRAGFAEGIEEIEAGIEEIRSFLQANRRTT